jgi:hypothetical protein
VKKLASRELYWLEQCAQGSPLPGPHSNPGTASYCNAQGVSPPCGRVFFIHVKSPSSYLCLHLLLRNWHVDHIICGSQNQSWWVILQSSPLSHSYPVTLMSHLLPLELSLPALLSIVLIWSSLWRNSAARCKWQQADHDGEARAFNGCRSPHWNFTTAMAEVRHGAGTVTASCTSLQYSIRSGWFYFLFQMHIVSPRFLFLWFSFEAPPIQTGH